MGKQYFKTLTPEEICVNDKPYRIQRLTGFDELVAHPSDEDQTLDYIYTVRANRHATSVREVAKKTFGNNLPEGFRTENFLAKIMDLGKHCLIGVIDVSNSERENNWGLKIVAEVSKKPGFLSKEFEYQQFGDIDHGEGEGQLIHYSVTKFALNSFINKRHKSRVRPTDLD
ncbi:hypothetical protein KBB76_03295 [Candidatus Saccharibacteria bacterium]|nr:hypothetical protein [Candidatus Saccharibacteria bacterium]HOR23125.1 hypothetical protein [Candidatus Saccharibacteria bacterium]HPW48234.1 hypothetical protein [Candidatus Saccharibacteria bacterium]